MANILVLADKKTVINLDHFDKIYPSVDREIRKNYWIYGTQASHAIPICSFESENERDYVILRMTQILLGCTNHVYKHTDWVNHTMQANEEESNEV